MKKVEFYNTPDGNVVVKPDGEPFFVYEQSCKAITDEMVSKIRNLYPGAFKALAELYSKSERNKDFFEFRIVHRFIRCNFGEFDALSYDINTAGAMCVEDVRCPLRGECLFEGIICKPKLQTALTQREREVARLLGQGLTNIEIAEELYISPFTVRRHIATIKERSGLKNTAQIRAKFANEKDC